jgi:hypothetical protein
MCRLSALECILEDSVFVNEGFCPASFVQAFRLIYAQLAAALQRLSANVAVGATHAARLQLWFAHPDTVLPELCTASS